MFRTKDLRNSDVWTTVAGTECQHAYLIEQGLGSRLGFPCPERWGNGMVHSPVPYFFFFAPFQHFYQLVFVIVDTLLLMVLSLLSGIFFGDTRFLTSFSPGSLPDFQDHPCAIPAAPCRIWPSLTLGPLGHVHLKRWMFHNIAVPPKALVTGYTPEIMPRPTAWFLILIIGFATWTITVSWQLNAAQFWFSFRKLITPNLPWKSRSEKWDETSLLYFRRQHWGWGFLVSHLSLGWVATPRAARIQTWHQPLCVSEFDASDELREDL